MARYQVDPPPSYGIYAAYNSECYATGYAVLDTALFEAAKMSKKYRATYAVWEETGRTLRGYGLRGRVSWPEPCKVCFATGKVRIDYVNETCLLCGGTGKVPE